MVHWGIRPKNRHRIATDWWIPKSLTHLTVYCIFSIKIFCLNLFIIYGLLRSVWCVWLLNSYVKIKEPSQESILYCPVINIYAKYSETSHSIYARIQYRVGACHLNLIFMLAIRFMITFHIIQCLNRMSSNNSVSVCCWCWCSSRLGSTQKRFLFAEE